MIVWHLTFFHHETEELVCMIDLTEEQAKAIWLSAHPGDPDQFGEFPMPAYLGASDDNR